MRTSYIKVYVEIRTNKMHSIGMPHTNKKINGLEPHLKFVSSLQPLQQ